MIFLKLQEEVYMPIVFHSSLISFTCKVANPGGGGGALQLHLYGGCGHRIGKLTHPQTKAGPKTDPFSDYLQ